MAFYFFIGVIVSAAGLAGVYFGIRYVRMRSLARSLELVLMLVKISKDEKTGTQGAQQEKDFKIEINLRRRLASKTYPLCFGVSRSDASFRLDSHPRH